MATPLVEPEEEPTDSPLDPAALPGADEEENRPVLDAVKEAGVWLALRILGALIDAVVLLLLANGHGPA